MALDAADDRRLPVKAVAEPPEAPLGIWRAFQVARRNVLGIVPRGAYEQPVLRGGRGAGWLMVQDPPIIEQVLKRRAKAYPRSEVTRRILKPTDGDNLFTAGWDDWRWQHRAMTPIFQHRKLRELSHAMTASAVATADRLTAQAGETVDVYPEMITATFDVINDTAFQSGDERLDRARVSRGVTRFIETVGRISLLDILGAPAWVPRPARLFSRGGRELDALIDAVIAGRAAARARGETAAAPDLLDHLIDARDPETGRAMTPVEVRNNLTAFIVAGHETTALALTWALYLVAFDQGVQARVRTATRDALGDRAPTADDLPALAPVRRVLDEALRLYPPAGFMARSATEDDEIGGHEVRKGAVVMIPIYALHRRRGLWDDPDAFDPDRFAPEAVAARHRCAWLPFGAGPRICIGMGFALMEATVILAAILTRVAVATPRGAAAPKPEMVLTLRPTGGMPLAISTAP